jgi:hypothetical protein
MLMMICLTISVGAVRSIRRLWMRISYESQVLEPSPQGVLRVCRLPLSVPVSRLRAGSQDKRGKTHRDLEGLGGEADGALGAEVLVLGTLNELLADLLEGLNLAGGQGDAWCVLSVECSAGRGKSLGYGRILWTLGASPNSFSGFW